MSTHTIIIPAAGLGTRFLPLTKSIPKEMLPLLNKPAIHYIVDEGKRAQFNRFAFVVSEAKESLKHYFSQDGQLEQRLHDRNKDALVQSIKELRAHTHFDWIIQQEPRGLGHAISCARSCISEDFFAVVLPDDVLINGYEELTQMRKIAHERNASVIAVQEVPQESISAYGVIKPKDTIDEHHYTIASVVEKPKAEEAPSSLAILGRYIFTAEIFNYLDKLTPGAQGEIQLTDAITNMINDGHSFIAHKITSRRFDLGTPHGWLEANNYINTL